MKKILNIFSKKKTSKKEIPTQKIIIDNREKNSLVISELISLNCQVEFQQLPVADYIINEIAIERKTISDLKSSIINKRIISQMREIKQYPKNLLLLEGFENEDIYQGIIHENALRGLLLSISLDYQVPIIFTKNEKDTAKYLFLLSKKSDKKEFSLRPSKISFSKEEQLQYILEGFPGIGPVTAKELLKKFGSLKNIINANEEELKEILGKKHEEFKSLIEYNFKD